jgi:hypothetical protein
MKCTVPGAEQHGAVAVVAAGVHLPGMLRAVREGIRLLDGQRVHVGAQSDRTPTRSSAQRAHHASAGEAPKHFDAARLELAGHDVGRALFAEGELRMRM